MSKFLKQAKIKNRQAEMWMEVCHFAMATFPDVDWQPEMASAAICGLLANLAHRNDVLALTDDQVNWYSGLKRDPTTLTPVCDQCSIVMPAGDAESIVNWIDYHSRHTYQDVETHSLANPPERIAANKKIREFRLSNKWFASLKPDPITGQAICDVCGNVMPADSPESFAAWLEFHQGHPRETQLVKNMNAARDVNACLFYARREGQNFLCELPKGHEGSCSKT